MIKKTALLVFAVLFIAGFAHSLDLNISGEIKTGLFWDNVHFDGEDPSKSARLHHNEDAGSNEGRFRMDMHLQTEGNFGMRVRFEQESWTGSPPIRWDYAYAYGNFIDNQLGVTAGLLGLSPWTKKSRDILEELETFGIRFEFKPNATPGLNFGLTLNRFNKFDTRILPGEDEVRTLANLLLESVFGVTYKNDFFEGMFSWRLDGDYDHSRQVFQGTDVIRFNEGHEFMYYLSPTIVSTIVPYLSVWANGWWTGLVNDDVHDEDKSFRNWLYAEYNPENFIAELALGLEINGTDSHFFRTRAGFYYNIFPFLSAGSAFRMNLNFGDNIPDFDTFYRLITIEPEVRVTLGTAVFSLVYSFSHGYIVVPTDNVPKTGMGTNHWINLRAVISF